MKITVHRALARIKTTEARLRDILNSSSGYSLIDIYSMKKGTCTFSAKSEEDTKKIIQGNWDKFNSLYNELVSLKRAVTISNSGLSPEDYEKFTDKIEVGKNKYTVAEIIVLNSVLKYKEAWFGFLKRNYSDVLKQYERYTGEVNRKLDEHISMMLGSDAKKTNDAAISDFSEMYLKKNGYTLVDPLNLVQKINDLEVQLDNLKTEADAALSDANALRIIEADVK